MLLQIFPREVEIWMKNLKKRCFILPGRLGRRITCFAGRNKKICNNVIQRTDYERKKKNVTKSDQKWRRHRSEAVWRKHWGFKARNRQFALTMLTAGALRQKRIGTHAQRSYHTVFFFFFSLLKLLFLVSHWHCWSLKAFNHQTKPKTW